MPGPSALVDLDYLVGHMTGSVLAQYSVLAALEDLSVITLSDLLPRLQERLDGLLEEAAVQTVFGAEYSVHEPLEMLVVMIKGALKSSRAEPALQRRLATTGSVPASGGASQPNTGEDATSVGASTGSTGSRRRKG